MGGMVPGGLATAFPTRERDTTSVRPAHKPDVEPVHILDGNLVARPRPLPRHASFARARPSNAWATAWGREGSPPLNVKVQLKLIGMRPQAHRIDFLATLILQPGLNHILREHIPLGEKRVVVLQGVERSLE